MKTEEDSLALAEEMVRIGKNAGRRTIAVVSDMDQPLGCAVGNALEVKEAIDTLKGCGPADFEELCMTLGAQMLLAGGVASEEAQAREMLQKTIEDGSALRKLAEFVEAQGGDAKAVYEPDLLPKANILETICAEQEGYISHIECDEIGICSLILGGGRETKESEIDLRVGLILHKKVGDYVEKGESLATIHAADKAQKETAVKRFLEAYRFSNTPIEKTSVIKQIIS